MDALVSFIIKVLVYGGGSAAIALGVFKFLGEKWIENKFSERLTQLEHEHAIELQRLRIEIDSLLSGVLKLQEKEFEVLPGAWEKIDEAKGKLIGLVASMRRYSDLEQLSPEKLEEFLSSTRFTETEKKDIRTSPEKTKKYEELSYWHHLRGVESSVQELHVYIARNGIFLPIELKNNFSEISDMLLVVVLTHQLGQSTHNWQIKMQAWEDINKRIEPLYKAIEAGIQARLQSHARTLK